MTESYEQIVENPEYYLDEGLVHEVYADEHLVYKVPKPEFTEFHQPEHFFIEQASLAALSDEGVPTPRIHEIVTEPDVTGGRPILIEDRVSGTNVSQWPITDAMIESVAAVYEAGHGIDVEGFGPLNSGLAGSYDTWGEYLSEAVSEAVDYVTRKHLLGVDVCPEFEKLTRSLVNGESCSREKFVFTDLNLSNVFFEDGQVRWVIDVDHPIGGDPLFDFGCMRWYNQELFQRVTATRNFTSGDQTKIRAYELLHGLTVLAWRDRNGLDTSVERRRLHSVSESTSKLRERL